MINKDNIEEFLIDYLEDNLSFDIREEVCAFLDDHPNIKEDIKSISEAILYPETIKYNEKENLYQSENVCKFENECIEYIEKQLNNNDYISFKTLAKNDIFKRDIFKAYNKTILVADKSIIFEDKNLLKRNFSYKHRSVVHFASAAAILLLISLSVFLFPTDINKQISKNTNDFVIPKVEIPNNAIPVHKTVIKKTIRKKLVINKKKEIDKIPIIKDMPISETSSVSISSLNNMSVDYIVNNINKKSYKKFATNTINKRIRNSHKHLKIIDVSDVIVQKGTNIFKSILGNYFYMTKTSHKRKIKANQK